MLQFEIGRRRLIGGALATGAAALVAKGAFAALPERRLAFRNIHTNETFDARFFGANGWDAQGQLWHTAIGFPWVVYELPGVLMENFGNYDLLKGSYTASLINDMKVHFQQVPRYPESNFTPESMSARGVR